MGEEGVRPRRVIRRTEYSHAQATRAPRGGRALRSERRQHLGLRAKVERERELWRAWPERNAVSVWVKRARTLNFR